MLKMISFLRRIPGKSQQGRDGDGEGAEIGISMLSAAGWTRQGDDVCLGSII